MTLLRSLPAVGARRPVSWVTAGLVVFIVALVAGWAIQREFAIQRVQAAARLESLAELRATQVHAWVDRQLNSARFLEESADIAALLLQSQEVGNAAAGSAALQRALAARQTNDADDVMLVDAQGRPLVQDGVALPAEVSRRLGATVHEAIALGRSRSTGLYHSGEAAMPQRIDIVVPLLRTGTPARGALVLRIDPRHSLLAMLSGWPVPSASAESVLWDGADGHVVNLSSLRRGAAGAAHIDQATASSRLPIARVVRGDVPPGVAFRGTDFWGAEVLLVALPVAGTSWYLASKIDLAEVDEPAWRNARWILFAAFLALLGMAFASGMLHQRRIIERSLHERIREGDRLQTLGLLEAIAQSAADPIYALDLEGRYVFCNRAASRVVGLAPEDVLGHTNAELFGAEATRQFSENNAAAMAAPAALVFEERLTTPNGPVVMLSTKGRMFDAGGRLIGMLCVSRDVTDTRRAEGALRDSEAHYRSVVAVLSEGIVVSDAQARPVSCNPAAEQLLGLTIDQWRAGSGTPPGWTVLRDDGSALPDAELPTRKVIAGLGPQRNVLVRATNPAGRPVIFEVSATPVFSPGAGELMAVVTSFIDVTRRKTLEDELHRHRHQLEQLVGERTRDLKNANDALRDAALFNRSIADAIPGAVSYWDTDLRCRFVNEQYAGFFKLTPQQILGRTGDEVFGAAALARVRDKIDGALGGAPQHFVSELTLPDGSLHVQQVHYIPEKTAEGVVRGLYVMGFDISALKRVESDLKAANHALGRSRDDAEKANRAKSAFLANMSHEIRTPMNAIIGMTHLITRDTKDPLQSERLGKVADAAQHLLQILNDVLDLSKIEADKLVLEQEDFSLHGLLSRSMEMVSQRAEEKGLALTLDVGDAPADLCGDATRLSQMLINLLHNAVKFTARGWVRARVDLAGQDGDRLLLRFEVQDSGEGISAERQSALFNAFEQADASMTRRHGGTGLGLALTRQLSQAMGGEVGVVSEVGKGSSFWFTAWLERARQTVPTPATRPAAECDGERRLLRLHAGQRVLLAEDNLVNRLVAQQLLCNAGLDVETAHDGEEALQLALSRRYDLILMDMQMPTMDGLDATRQLRRLAGHRVPIIAMTANAFAEDRALCIDAGMDDHVAKPVDPTVLYRTLLRWLPDGSEPAAAPPSTVSATRRDDAAAELPGSLPALFDRLRSVEGLDAGEALERVGGDVALLADILGDFARLYGEGDARLQWVPTADHLALWRDICHSAGGAAATIGAVDVARQASELAAEIKRGAPPQEVARDARELHHALRQLSQRLSRQLETALETQPS